MHKSFEHVRCDFVCFLRVGCRDDDGASADCSFGCDPSVVDSVKSSICFIFCHDRDSIVVSPERRLPRRGIADSGDITVLFFFCLLFCRLFSDGRAPPRAATGAQACHARARLACACARLSATLPRVRRTFRPSVVHGPTSSLVLHVVGRWAIALIGPLGAISSTYP